MTGRLGINSTTPATTWELISVVPHTFPTNKLPKALFFNVDGGSLTVIDTKGTSMTFFPVAGVPIPIQPRQIVSFGGGLTSCIALFD